MESRASSDIGALSHWTFDFLPHHMRIVNIMLSFKALICIETFSFLGTITGRNWRKDKHRNNTEFSPQIWEKE